VVKEILVVASYWQMSMLLKLDCRRGIALLQCLSGILEHKMLLLFYFASIFSIMSKQ